jgi:hypothetical protein
MKSVLHLIFLFALILLFSCEDSMYVTNCDECEEEEPVTTTLAAELDPDYSAGVVVMLWEGRLEDNIRIDSTKSFSGTYNKKVSLNRTYTVTAIYIKGNKIYTSVDSTTPRIRYTEDMCDEPCYYVYDKQLDLRLKYTK